MLLNRYQKRSYLRNISGLRTQTQVQHKRSLLDNVRRELKLSQPLAMHLQGSQPSQRLARAAIHQVRAPVELLLAVAR